MSIPNMLTSYYENFSLQPLLPKQHIDYLKQMNIKPKVIYDLGACVLHWTNEAQKIWPESKIYQMDAMQTLEDFYKLKKLDYHIGAFSDKDDEDVKFYVNPINPGGNSLNRERNDEYFPKDRFVEMKTCTLDSVRKQYNWPYPDLIKLDLQSKEVDTLKGATDVLKHCNDLIVELQHVEYNENGILADEAIREIYKMGFKLVRKFTETAVDGDYHFTRIENPAF